MTFPETCQRRARMCLGENRCGGGAGEIAPPRRYCLSICRLEADVGSEGYPQVVQRAVI